MPRRLPLFPLSLVLFPGTPLPLHIFEPRYRRLLTDVQAGDGCFGVVPFDSSTEVPPLGTVGSVARVVAADALPDGRSNILVHGERRFYVLRYADPGTPYHVGDVEEIDDLAGTEPAPADLAALRAAGGRYVDLLNTLTDTGTPDRADDLDAEALSFRVAAALDVDTAAKQHLLTLRSTAERVALLRDLLPPITAAAERAVAVHRRAHRNGQGGQHPNVVTG